MILLTHERQWRGGETVVAFGMFDGVHEGHAQLMRKANELAALHADGHLLPIYMAVASLGQVGALVERKNRQLRSG